jgi:hypothetical protein
VPRLDPTIDTLSDETDPAIVSPADVATVYDVVGLVVTGQHATMHLADGAQLDATWTGGFAAPALTEVTDDATLGTCAGCFRHSQLAPGLERVQVSASGAVTAGGLALAATGARRIRWDLYIVTP